MYWMCTTKMDKACRAKTMCTDHPDHPAHKTQNTMYDAECFNDYILLAQYISEPCTYFDLPLQLDSRPKKFFA